MKTHTTYGGNVIAEISKRLGNRSFLIMTWHMAYYHHEHWDRTGYPEGLSGEDVLFSARIVAIVDVYDALTSKRYYKEAFSHEKAFEIIASEKGKHSDPELTDFFLSLESKILFIKGQIDIKYFITVSHASLANSNLY